MVKDLKISSKAVGSILERCCTNAAAVGVVSEQLKKDNHQVVEGFQKCGENITFIDDDYEKVIRTVLAEIER